MPVRGKEEGAVERVNGRTFNTYGGGCVLAFEFFSLPTFNPQLFTHQS